MYNRVMRLRNNGLWSLTLVVGLTAASPPQTTSGAQRAPLPSQPQPDKPTFSLQIDLVTTDVIARDENGNFIADLNKDDFEILRGRRQAGHRRR